MGEPIQTIRSPSGDELVVMPRELYEELVDARAARDARVALDRGEEELLSEDEVLKLLASPTPLAFWRRKRELRQGELAAMLGTSQGYISDVEAGRRQGSLAFFKAAARELRVELDAILPEGGAQERKSSPAPDRPGPASRVRSRKGA